MSAKTLYLKALALTLVSGALVHAQDAGLMPSASGSPTMYPAAGNPAPTTGLAPDPSAPVTVTPATEPAGPPAQASAFMVYSRPECCGSHGCDGPVHSELFLRTGPSFPVGFGELYHGLSTGWEVDGGGRVLFFNPAKTAAWNIEVGIQFIQNHGKGGSKFPLFGQTDSVDNLYRTSAEMSVGRDWWVWGTAGTDSNLRVGADVGGRYGTARIDLQTPITPLHPSGYFRRSHKFNGAYADLHADLEKTCCGCTFLLGLRLEWDYDWMDLIPPNRSDVSDLNLLLSGGIRY